MPSESREANWMFMQKEMFAVLQGFAGNSNYGICRLRIKFNDDGIPRRTYELLSACLFCWSLHFLKVQANYHKDLIVFFISSRSNLKRWSTEKSQTQIKDHNLRKINNLLKTSQLVLHKLHRLCWHQFKKTCANCKFMTIWRLILCNYLAITDENLLSEREKTSINWCFMFACNKIERCLTLIFHINSDELFQFDL